MEWEFLATAPDQLTAEMWVAALRDAGIAAMIRPSDTSSFLGVSAFGTRVQVGAGDVERAKEVLGLDDGEID